MPSQTTPRRTFTAVVLAGERGPDDPVARASGVSCKALSPIGDKPMVLRVLETLASSRYVGSTVLCGPPVEEIGRSPRLKAGVDGGEWRWVKSHATPSSSAHAVLRSLPSSDPVLLTTADHPLLRSEILDYFCSRAAASGLDLAVALVPRRLVSAAHPDSRRTGWRFSDDTYCGCNLFAFLTDEARRMAELWQRVEQERKRPWRVVRILGWLPLMRYLTRRLSLDEALETLSTQLRMRIGHILLPFPEAAIDVDTVADWEYAQSLLTQGPDHRPRETQ